MGELVGAGSAAPPVLEPTEGPLDDIPRPISDGVERMFPFTRRVVGDDRLAATGPQPGAQRVAVVGSISQTARWPQGGHQGGSNGRVPPMPRPDNQPPGAPLLIDRRMDFGGPPSTRPPDCLLRRPPFPPAADRCALT